MIALLACLVWIYLYFFHGQFWASTPELPPARPLATPAIDIIVPARDEAQTIEPVIASLLAQDYEGAFRVILVDDDSVDGTAALAGLHPRLRVITGAPKPAGWTGKLAALSQGVAASTAPLILFTDADITHDPRHLASLVARLETPLHHTRLDMVSEMVRLNCTSPAERLLIPAFVYFFQMLYPFAQVNDPLSPTAAAAGGTILVRRDALDRIGGLGAIKGELIDDCALARRLKRQGSIFLGHSGLATSIRQYPAPADIWAMVSRTAYTQLRYNPLYLAATILGMTLVWLVAPAQVLFGHRWGFAEGLVASILAVLSYQPTLRRYRLPRVYAAALPFIALFYIAATIASAINRWRGGGAVWKARAYGPGAP
jgi:hopene-associated glycosyltransferase HpnB